MSGALPPPSSHPGARGKAPGSPLPCPCRTCQRRALQRRPQPGKGTSRCRTLGWKGRDGNRAPEAGRASGRTLPPSQRRGGSQSESSNSGPGSQPKPLFQEAVLRPIWSELQPPVFTGNFTSRSGTGGSQQNPVFTELYSEGSPLGEVVLEYVALWCKLRS